MIEAPRFSNRHKADAAKREVGKRRNFYPKWVAAGKMTQRQADREIALMEEIAADYARVADEEERAQRLL